jgi:hypothetical protein
MAATAREKSASQRGFRIVMSRPGTVAAEGQGPSMVDSPAAFLAPSLPCLNRERATGLKVGDLHWNRGYAWFARDA